MGRDMKAGRIRTLLLGSPASCLPPTLPAPPFNPGTLPSQRRKLGESRHTCLNLNTRAKHFLHPPEVPRTAGCDFTLWAVGQNAFKEQWIPTERLPSGWEHESGSQSGVRSSDPALLHLCSYLGLQVKRLGLEALTSHRHPGLSFHQHK